jgi:hypothetical protein
LEWLALCKRALRYRPSDDIISGREVTMNQVGRVLYDPKGYVTRRLAGLRRLIEERGLYRERVQDSLAWRWKEFPGFDWRLEWEAV